MKYQIAVIIEDAGRNYSAYAPEVPGCVSTGRSIEETLDNMREALTGHLEWMARDGDPMPESEPIEARVVEVDIVVPVPASV